MRIEDNFELLHRNTFGIEARAARYAEFASADELRSLLALWRAEEPRRPLLPVGGGSNLLFLNDFDGWVLHSCDRSVELLHQDDDSVILRVGAGMEWDALVEHTVRHGWWGIENLSAIPGEAGASAVQNVGAYGAEAKDCIVQVETVDVETGDERTFANEECRYGYRSSIFKEELRGRCIVTRVHYRLSRHPRPRLDYGGLRSALQGDVTLAAIRAAICSIRAAKLPDPREVGSAGSFFVNPVVGEATARRLLAQHPDMPCYPAGEGQCKLSAGWMIDRCGWKGRSLGRAGVYERQALVLVNRGGATGSEVMQLARAIQQSVEQRFGVQLHCEVNIIS